MTNYKEIEVTDAEMEAIEELRKRMIGKMDFFKLYNQEMTYYRFLKARNWDVNRAEIMLRKSLEYRRKINLEDLLLNYEPPKVLREFIADLHIGYDKEGCQVYYLPIGKADIKGFLKATKPIDIEKTITKLFNTEERIQEQRSREIERFLPGITIIVNLAEITLSTITNARGIQILLSLLQMQQDHAPERLKSLYIINAPSFFAILFNIIKQFLPMETTRKFNLYDENGWKEDLLEAMDADQLPMFLGGTRTDPDGNPLCKTIVNQFSTVDESDYLTKNGLELPNLPGVKKLHIPRASTSRLHINVHDPGSVIEWDIEMEAGDISFGLFTGNGDSEVEALEELIPMERVDTKDYVESGMYTCESPGYYCIFFDNTYSWFRSKDLYYRIRVVKPCDIKVDINEIITT